MNKREGIFAIIITILILSAFIIPFTVLSNVEKWYGSFLFWIVITVIIIILNHFLTRNWGDES